MASPEGPVEASSHTNLTDEIPGFLFIDHLAIAIPRGTLDDQVATYELLGFREIHREVIEGRDHVREALLQIGDGPNLVQLVEPLSADSPIQKALDRNGGKPAMNHVGIRVADARHAFDVLKARGFQIIDAAPRPGSRGTTVFFMHPKGPASNPLNIMVEVVQE